jgi:hypothetical protein
VYVRDLVAGTTSRVSRAAFGGGAPNGASSAPAVSRDGRYVAFASAAWNIVPGDTNGVVDAFVHDRTTNQTVRVDTDERGNQAGQRGFDPVLSGDGRYVVFVSSAPLTLPNPQGFAQVFVRHVVVPEIGSLAPTRVAPGTSASIVVSGRGFLPGLRVVLGAPGVTVGPAVRFNEQLFAVPVTAAPNATTGAHDVYVVNSGTGPGAGAGSVASCSACLVVGSPE